MTVKAKARLENAKARQGFCERDNTYSQSDESAQFPNGQADVDLGERNESEHETLQWMRVSEQSGALDFWKAPGEDLYTEGDGTPI